MAKPLEYKKKTIAIFIKFKHLVQYFKAAVIEHKLIQDSIMLIVALDLLYDNFKIITATWEAKILRKFS